MDKYLKEKTVQVVNGKLISSAAWEIVSLKIFSLMSSLIIGTIIILEYVLRGIKK